TPCYGIFSLVAATLGDNTRQNTRAQADFGPRYLQTGSIEQRLSIAKRFGEIATDLRTIVAGVEKRRG
ncbi:MAG: hypothetical protein VX090_16455, partial [Pseudomonadota bacterium]|nr:hypothetical protein [Pseudomonadota bacterium]